MQISKRFLWVSLLVLIALAGCAQAFPTVQVSELPTSAPTETIQAAAPDQPAGLTEEPATSEQPTAEPISTDVPVLATETAAVEPTLVPPTEVPTETTPLGSPELHATDPSTVSLASGKVQLVEFFAFW